VLPGSKWRVVAVVAAHNEEALIGPTVDSLTAAAAAFPGTAEILVVADNCTDATAAVAAQHGATVIERRDTSRRGKGFALEAAVRHLEQREMPPDAVLVVDADTAVSPNIFAAVTARIEAGAQAVQVHNAVLPGASEFERLRQLQFMLTQWARPLGMQRLGVGTALKGNGMAMCWSLARDVLGGGALAEDSAMTLRLAARGIAVEFEPRAEVRSVMPNSYGLARSQDERWEHGRARLLSRSLATAAAAARRGDWKSAVVAAELASPPLSLLAVAGAGSALAGVRPGRLRPLHLAAGASVALYVVLGLLAARARLSDFASLRFAPRYVGYKLGVHARFVAGAGATTWQRTSRVRAPSH
jgi:hypothetical protein